MDGQIGILINFLGTFCFRREMVMEQKRVHQMVSICISFCISTRIAVVFAVPISIATESTTLYIWSSRGDSGQSPCALDVWRCAIAPALYIYAPFLKECLDFLYPRAGTTPIHFETES